jgi:hypothetical protein
LLACKENSPWLARTPLFAQDEPVSRGGWGRTRRTSQRGQLGGHVGGFGRADPLEECQRLPQPGFGFGGAAFGPGTAGQAGEGVRLAWGGAHLAGQVQGLLVA